MTLIIRSTVSCDKQTVTVMDRNQLKVSLQTIIAAALTAVLAIIIIIYKRVFNAAVHW